MLFLSRGMYSMSAILIFSHVLPRNVTILRPSIGTTDPLPNRTIKQRERVSVPGHVAGRARVEVPSVLRLVVAVAVAGAEEDVRRWLMKMKAALRQPRRGIGIDLTDPRHQQRLLIILACEIRLLLLWRTTILCPVPFLATVVARVAIIFAAAPGAASAAVLLLIAWPILASARLGAALTGLFVLHPCQPLLLNEQQFAARTCRRIGFFFIRSSFDRPQTTGYLLN
jgi:hypothetical protein